MKITIPLTSLFLGFASYATINAQTAADTISSCQAQNSDNVMSSTSIYFPSLSSQPPPSHFLDHKNPIPTKPSYHKWNYQHYP